MSKDYQFEQLQRILDNPDSKSGLYLIDTDLEDKDIERFIKDEEGNSYSYVKSSLLTTKDSSSFDLFIIGLSHRCKNNEIEKQRNTYLTIQEGKEALMYNLSILVMRELCSTEKLVLHIQGENDLNSLGHEDLCKLSDSLEHRNTPILVICKRKRSSNAKCDSNIILLSFKQKNILMENRLTKVYISYKHDATYEGTIKAIKTGLTKAKIAYSIDEHDIKYRDNIEEYEKEIGEAERVIMFITDSYLKSIDCMFEMTRIFRNKNVKERVFPVVTMQTTPRNGDGLKQIEKYWEDEKNRKLDDMKKSGNTDFLHREFQKIDDILQNINDFWEYLVHVNTGSYGELTANDAYLLMEELQKEIPITSSSLNRKILPPEGNYPLKSREILQNGDKSLYIENNNGSITIN